MVMTLEKYEVESEAVTERESGFAEAGRAISAALVSRTAATFTIETDSSYLATEFASPLRLFLLMSDRISGGVSATVSPHFSEETYPALLDLVGRLNDSGARDLWKPDGARSLAVGDAHHMFISTDMPVVERSSRPDRLLELVASDRISANWYRSRVAPKLYGDSLVKVFYGRRDVAGSAFAAADAEAMAEEAMTGERRRFSLLDTDD